MKQFSLILFSLLVCSSSVRGGDAMPGDLLRTLNAAIDSSEVYTGYKKARIEELRLRCGEAPSVRIGGAERPLAMAPGVRRTSTGSTAKSSTTTNPSCATRPNIMSCRISGSPAASATRIISPRAGCGWRSSTPCRGFSCRPTTFSGLSTTDGCLPTRNAAITGTRSAITRI